MNTKQRWRLPDGVEELLPESARCLESLRRRLVDLYLTWGYEPVNPPMIEYLDSLLTGAGKTLDIQTFKLVDQLTGRSMGVRADMTPQVARIDVHQLGSTGVTRLCYMGSVLRTLPDGPGGSRSPIQLGTEIYGHAGTDSDIETILLMLQTLEVAGVKNAVLDIGHVGVFRAMTRYCELNEGQVAELLEILQRKSRPDMQAYMTSLNLDSKRCSLFSQLLSLEGSAPVLDQAMELLRVDDNADIQQQITDALTSVRDVVDALESRSISIPVSIDFAELRGYSYHTGVVFSVFSGSHRRELARGGRYDDIGAEFGRARPATGFSTDLKQLVQIHQKQHPSVPVSGIFVSADLAEAAWSEVQTLRADGERVVMQLKSSDETAQSSRCDRQLVFRNKTWQVEPL